MVCVRSRLTDKHVVFERYQCGELIVYRGLSLLEYYKSLCAKTACALATCSNR